ncbi:MAG: Methyl-accepting chemotaxis sensory transducer [Candidatus Wolfebacteria bacterium GW2011_GWE1_48_7]|uniref:Methyl-accepting chemotaxis sensory transducer n=2 Tax=Candidatus Wolfeibacteriota TaxID=1752735 RepID=A0A0G1WH46_9BACT|nr:MAG: Methyl-accepting chemotaxis sensory transducer [Candidatus Wolfebacteria bacterium GW2011_GWB1_47_1]KKU36773.1 MAG: Methyl-accepting chemotaxis sensory transducer [Candidatus Wolfebacteria bacterium GW2011_GWC2_46_275]KKU42313.1 MAG: Methyl-accepting chemotaxis sensory transducer [Candidatus Wolfebacteria bacterium GW2011_GWB2_46_69]KKU53681.1 MAG: Methyl-accepting chemotaxis sensory transducer [Candidatus Wolfebacteria bacterium GW2011_GWC1_47_103]KKU58926.1 MAG: Methyl-accepting chemo
MAHINWIKEYSVGVELIDEQHRYFLTLLNELFDAIISLNTESKIGDIITRLAEYAVMHFATEEKYFDEFNYEFAEDHKRRHRDLLARVEGFQKAFDEGEVNIASEMIEFLEGWMIDHIMEVDKKYVRCFEEHGLQ